jgi:hypothetical protein
MGINPSPPFATQNMANYSKSPTFKNQSPFSSIEKVASRLAVFGPGDEVFVSGSCVRIAKNLCLTARHVMTDYLERFGHNAVEADFTVWAIHVHHGPEYSIWTMDRLWLSPHSDLAVFHTMPYNDTATVEKISWPLPMRMRCPFLLYELDLTPPRLLMIPVKHILQTRATQSPVSF